MSGSRVAVVLAAGKGTRMRSDTPKVLHEAAGRPLLEWVLDAARAAGCARIVVVVGHGAEAVRDRFDSEDIVWALQAEQNGTGHAVLCAREAVTEALPDGGTVLVLSGDVPLVRPATLDALVQAAEGGWGAMAVAEAEVPGALGRVTGRGRLEKIVEAADATPEELEIRTINAGIYALPAPDVFARLESLGTDNAQGEIYLTDAVTAAAGEGVALVSLEDREEALGVNDRADLARAHRALVRRKIAELSASGVTVLDPDATTVEDGVSIGPDTTIWPGVCLLGRTTVGRGVTLHAGAWAKDSEIGDGAEVLPYSTLQGASLGPATTVGPFARLRPGARLEEGAKVGNFVEVKNSTLGPGAKANHLAYVGDAEVGERANIGAGVVTCNYDGRNKHRTEIGRGAFIGSDTMLVAPVKVGDRATTGAGSTITQDVPDDALGVARARQRNLRDWSKRKK